MSTVSLNRSVAISSCQNIVLVLRLKQTFLFLLYIALTNMLSLRKPVVQYVPRAMQSRSLWEFINLMFNKPDPDRIKEVGPDRACAEWVLRNGGSVVWTDGRKLADYNSLPPASQHTQKLKVIDGTESSISHHGFPHLSGCTLLEKIILHNNMYIDNRAMEGLSYGKTSLTHVQVSKCGDVTDSGVKNIADLKELKEIVLFDLEGVDNLEECKKYLQNKLPHCHIQGSPQLNEKP